MSCYHPIPARRSQNGGPWRLNPPLGEADATLPCGKCLGCRTARQNQWVHRCVHEAQLWDHNLFINLTYDDEHCPHELTPHHLQTFFKRLRKHAQTNDNILTSSKSSIRYLACGEYGDRYGRPHYHANLFNCGFKDLVPYSSDLYTSHTLTQIWQQGGVKVAPFTAATAGYVAGYITAHGHTDYVDEDGVLLQPPFKRQSSRPALGADWLRKFHADIAQGVLIDQNGHKQQIPRYYRKLLDKLHRQHGGAYSHTAQLVTNQLATEKPATDQFSPARLADAERIHTQRHERKHRDLE